MSHYSYVSLVQRSQMGMQKADVIPPVVVLNVFHLESGGPNRRLKIPNQQMPFYTRSFSFHPNFYVCFLNVCPCVYAYALTCGKGSFYSRLPAGACHMLAMLSRVCTVNK